MPNKIIEIITEPNKKYVGSVFGINVFNYKIVLMKIS